MGAATYNIGAEVNGILFHEMTHMYRQDDGDKGGVDIGLIEGIADSVRINNGFTPDMDSRDGKPWTPEALRTITGRTVNQLWEEYRKSNSSPIPTPAQGASQHQSALGGGPPLHRTPPPC